MVFFYACHETEAGQRRNSCTEIPLKNFGNCVTMKKMRKQCGKESVVQDMKTVLQEELIYEILSVVGEIPEGSVATYGQIAKLIGRDKNARLVGKVLGMAQYYGDYPCHRVVNHAGRLVPGWREQRFLLQKEGVPFKDEGHVDLKKCRWEG